MVVKLWALIIGGQKTSRPFGSEATFFASLHSKLLLFERPGFESRPGQTLRTYIFAVQWPTWPKIIFMKGLINVY